MDRRIPDARIEAARLAVEALEPSVNATCLLVLADAERVIRDIQYRTLMGAAAQMYKFVDAKVGLEVLALSVKEGK